MPKPRVPAMPSSLLTELFPAVISRGTQRKIDILEAAIEVLADKEMVSLNMEHVSRQAQISRPLLQHHFSDKRVLFATAMKLVRGSFQALAMEEINRGKTPQQKLDRYLGCTFEWATQRPKHVQAWAVFYAACGTHKELRQEHTAMTKMGEERIVALLAANSCKGDLSLKARSVQRLITGSMIEWLTEDRPLPLIAKECKMACLTVIHS